MRVLLVEDDPTTSKSIEMMLTSANLNVYTTDLGEEGIDLAKLYDYDLILLDINLPDMNGHEVLRWIRNDANASDLPVIVLSGHPLVGEYEEMFHLGVDAHFKKSEGLSALYEKVDSVLRPTPH